MDECDDLLAGQPLQQERPQEVGALDATTAISLGLSGLAHSVQRSNGGEPTRRRANWTGVPATVSPWRSNPPGSCFATAMWPSASTVRGSAGTSAGGRV